MEQLKLTSYKKINQSTKIDFNVSRATPGVTNKHMPDICVMSVLKEQ